MKPPLFLRLAALTLLLLAARPLKAQHVLMADHGGKLVLVQGAEGTDPCMMQDGKLQVFRTRGMVLGEVPEYLPIFVNIDDVHAQVRYEMTSSGSGMFNVNLAFGAALKSDFRLKNVFLVLIIETELGKKSIFLSDVGTLEPGKRFPFSALVPFNMTPTESWHYRLHLFSGGAELFQSMIPAMEQNHALDRMVSVRVKGVEAAPPSVLFATAPAYPEELKGRNLKGSAVVSVLIGATGDVNDATVKSATDPAFGREAVRAVKMWRFVPKVAGGMPVESRASVPVAFGPGA